MIIYSTCLKAIFWIVMGLLYALMIAGAPIWADDLGLHMSWWKWVLASLWYVFWSYSFAAAFTLRGEKEPGPGTSSWGPIWPWPSFWVVSFGPYYAS